MTVEQQWRQQGRQEGRQELVQEMARRMLVKQLDMETIIELTGLSESELQQLRA
ncbi:MAG: hypothetical protein PW844_28340 [Pantoea sp.]|uniref:hypothetical protein n=1 Tax=Pantoea sp. TaxID=69393 RepID=UPI0023851EFC|nr:hypothetical protein [Pantoea sp.]MDE1190326.1 hypothetical protein [Pantoea sp.]